MKFAHQAADHLKSIGKIEIDGQAYTAVRINDKDILELNGHKFMLLTPDMVETWRVMLEYWDEHNHRLLDRRSVQTQKMYAPKSDSDTVE